MQLTSGVTILAHDYSYSVIGNAFGELPRIQRMTTIGNNVFIGINSIVLPGTQIGDNVIIGAGSVVHGSVESNSVYAGNPAKRIYSLEEYKERCKKQFEESAKCYYTKNKEKRVDMICYSALYMNSDEYNELIQKSTFQALEDKTKIDMRCYKKYANYNEMISTWEGNNK